MAGLSATVAILALLLVLTLLAWCLRAAKRHRAMAGELHESRANAHALAQLLDVWQWRTDGEHRLVSLHTPRGSTSGSAAVNKGKPLLWDHFTDDADAIGLLQSLMGQHAPLEALRVPPRPNADSDWALSGIAQLDHQGRFNGYIGTARALTDLNAALSTELLDAMPLPVFGFRCETSPSARQPVLCSSNAAATALLGAAPSCPLPLNEVLPQLPAALRSGVEQAVMAPAGSAPTHAVEGWTLHTHRLVGTRSHEGRELLLVLEKSGQAASDAVAETQDDQASFSYTVSHDLRAPIRVVEGFTKIVKEDYGLFLDRIGNDHLDRVLGAAARMNSMIDSLLTLSQLSSRPLSRQPVNLSQLAGYIIDDLRRQSPERTVQVEIEPGLLANGDATLLRVVLENLLGNAWKYTSKCRTAHIWVERSEHEGHPAITVRDNGAGFDMRFVDRLFGVFQRLHSANDFQGTGVGLASVRRIVRRHGGDIWAEGEVDRGAKFHFWLGPQR